MFDIIYKLMMHFIVLILIQFNIHAKDWYLKEKYFDWHVKYDLRDTNDWKTQRLTNFDTLIKEYREIKKYNYPDLAWGYNFNCFGTCCTKPPLDFNLQYQAYCMIQMQFGTEAKINSYAKCLEEARELYQIYNCLDNMYYEFYSVFDKRKFLHILRKKIGEQDFYAGILPPPVPIWRFELFD